MVSFSNAGLAWAACALPILAAFLDPPEPVYLIMGLADMFLMLVLAVRLTGDALKPKEPKPE